MGKKVWIFNHYAGPPSVASGLRHYNFAKNLICDGYPTTVFCSSAIHNSDMNMIEDGAAYREDSSEGVPFVYLKTRQYTGNGRARVLNMLDYYRGLFRVTKRFETPDVILASSVHPLACVAGIKIAKKLKIPCICEIRDLWPEAIVDHLGKSRKNPLIRLLYSLERWIYRKANRLIFVMGGGGEYISDKGWSEIDVNKISYIGNGVDLDGFLCDLPENEEPKRSEEFIVTYAGSLRKAYDLTTLLRAAHIVQAQNTSVKFVFYGDGDDFSSLCEKQEQLGLHNVEFKGHIPKRSVPSVLMKSDLNVLHCAYVDLLKYGMSANKMYEYFACGKPVLSTIRFRYNDILRFGAGIEAKSYSPEDIAAAVLEIVSCPKEKYDAFCKNAIKASRASDFKTLTQSLIEIIESI